MMDYLMRKQESENGRTTENDRELCVEDLTSEDVIEVTIELVEIRELFKVKVDHQAATKD